MTSDNIHLKSNFTNIVNAKVEWMFITQSRQNSRTVLNEIWYRDMEYLHFLSRCYLPVITGTTENFRLLLLANETNCIHNLS